MRKPRHCPGLNMPLKRYLKFSLKCCASWLFTDLLHCTRRHDSDGISARPMYLKGKIALWCQNKIDLV